MSGSQKFLTEFPLKGSFKFLKSINVCLECQAIPKVTAGFKTTNLSVLLLSIKWMLNEKKFLI